jgi:phage I-like protein
VFRFEPSHGDVRLILRAGLTNSPNLELTALASAEGAMDDVLTQLRELLGLDPAASPADVLAKVREMVQAAQHASPDPARFVPIGELRKVATELAGHARADAERTVSAAVAGGQLPPSLRDWAITLCSTDRAAFAGLSRATLPAGR